MKTISSNLFQERTLQQLIGTRTLLVINLKGAGQKGFAFVACILGSGGFGTTASDLEDGLQLAAVGEGMGACEHFDNETSQRPDVGLAGVRGLFDDFGGHPEDGALEGRTIDVAAFGWVEEGGSFNTLGDSEIRDLDRAFVVDENVGTLDIPVDDVFAVEVGKTVEDLANKVADQRFFQLSVIIEHRSHRTTRHVFKENVKVLVVAVGTQVLHNVWVLQVAEEVDLALEGGDHDLLTPVNIAIGFRGHLDLLDSHQLAGDGMQGEENAAK